MRKSTRALALILMILTLVGMMPFALLAEEADGTEATEPETPAIDTSKPYPEQIADYVTSVGGSLIFAQDYTGLDQQNGVIPSVLGGTARIDSVHKSNNIFYKDGVAKIESILANTDDPFLNMVGLPGVSAMMGKTLVIEGSFKVSEAIEIVVNEETGESVETNVGVPDGLGILYGSDRTGGGWCDQRFVDTLGGNYVTGYSKKPLAVADTENFVNIKVVAVQALNIIYYYVNGEYVAFDRLHDDRMNSIIDGAAKNNDKYGIGIIRFAHISGAAAKMNVSVYVDDTYIYIADAPYGVDAPYNKDSYIQNTLLPYLTATGNRLIAGSDFDDDRYSIRANDAVTVEDSGESIDGKIFYDAYYNILDPANLNKYNKNTTANYLNGTQWDLRSNLHNFGHVLPHVKYTLVEIKKEENGNNYLAYQQGNPYANDSYMDIIADNSYTPGSAFVLSADFSRFEDTTASFGTLFQFRLGKFGNGKTGTAADGTTATYTHSGGDYWAVVLKSDTHGRVFVTDWTVTTNADKTISATSANVYVGQLFADEFTTFSIAGDPKTNTMQVYVNGRLVYTGYLVDPVKVNQFTVDGKTYVFDDPINSLFDPASIRMGLNERNQGNANYGGINVDNLVWYTGTMPVEAQGDTTPLSGWQNEGGYWRYYKDGVAQLGEQTIDGVKYYFERNNAYASVAERVQLFDLYASLTQTVGDDMNTFFSNVNLAPTDTITGSGKLTYLWADIYKTPAASAAGTRWNETITINFNGPMHKTFSMKMNQAYAVTKETSDSYTAWRFENGRTYYDLTDFTEMEVIAYSNMDITAGWCILLNSDNLTKTSIGYNEGSWTSFGADITDKGSKPHNYSVTQAKNLVITEGWNTIKYNMFGTLPTAGNRGTFGRGRGGNLSNINGMAFNTTWSNAGYGIENFNELMLYFDSINFVKYVPTKDIPAAGFINSEDGTRYYESSYDYATGWKEIEGNKYYFFPYNGLMAVGNAVVDGVGMQFDDDGKLLDETANGWFTFNGIECIFIDGKLQTGAFEYDGVNYFANSTGKIWSKVGAIGYVYDKEYAAADYTGRELSYVVAQNFDTLTAGTFFGNYNGLWNQGLIGADLKNETLSTATMRLAAKGTHFNVVAEGEGNNALEITQLAARVDSYVNINTSFTATKGEDGKYTYQYNMPDGSKIDAAQNLVLEYDLKLGGDWDADVGLGQVIGYTDANKRTFGPAVIRLNHQGYVYLGTDKTKVICKLDTEVYTNIAMVFDQHNRTYDVYVNGVCKISDASYNMPAGWIVTELRSFQYSSGYDNGSLFLDNFYCFIGDTPSLYDPDYKTEKVQNGWVTEGGVKRYYQDGLMRMSAIEVAGEDGIVRYYNFDSLNGSLIGVADGWVDGKFYVGGVLQTEKWVEDENGTYYVDAEGVALKGYQNMDGIPYYFNTSTGAVEKKGESEDAVITTVDQILDYMGGTVGQPSYSILKDGLNYVYKPNNIQNIFAVSCLEKQDLSSYDMLAIDIWLGGENYTGRYVVSFGESSYLYHLAPIYTEKEVTEEVTDEETGETTTVTKIVKELTGYKFHDDGAKIFQDKREELAGYWKDTKQGTKIDGTDYGIWTLSNGENVEYYGRLWAYGTYYGYYDGMVQGWNTIYIPMSQFGGHAKNFTQIGFSSHGWGLWDGNSKIEGFVDYEVAFGDIRVVNLADYGTEVTNGWVDFDGNKFFYENGEMFTGYKMVDGVMCQFNEDGVYLGLANGKVALTLGNFVDNGKKLAWVTYDAERIYVEGVYQTGKVTLDGVDYYCDETDGAILKNAAIKLDLYVYNCNENGVMTPAGRVWYEDETGRYYTKATGEVNTSNSIKVDGYFYGFDAEGKMIVDGFVKVGTTANVRYCGPDGKCVTGIYDKVVVGYNEDGTPIYKTAYFNTTNAVKTVPADGIIDGVKYDFDEDGYILGVHCDHEIEVLPGKAPTCTEAGLTDGETCTICGKVLAEQTEIPALGHTEVTIPGKAATCTDAGMTDGTKCSVCGETLVEQTVIEALGHTEVILPAVDVTCTENGLTEGKVCSVCATVIVEQTEILAQGHQYDDEKDATCNVCGEEREIEVEENLIAEGKCGATVNWKLREDGTLVIYGEGGMEDCFDVNGQPYKAYAAQITKVVVEEGVIFIGRNAFYGFTAITEVVLPESLMAIEEYAFYGCSGITEFSVPAKVFYIGKYAFRRSGVTTFNFADQNGWAFVDGTAVDFSTARPFTKDATYMLACMKSVEGEGTVIAGGEFGNGFTWTLSDTGVLNVTGEGDMPKFNVNTTPWYGYRGAIRTVVIGDGITSVGRCSFHTCRAIVSVTMPETITYIAEYAFYNMPYIKGIKIPAAVSKIEAFVLRKCVSLESIEMGIYYGWYIDGTKMAAVELYNTTVDAFVKTYYKNVWERDVNAPFEDVNDPYFVAAGACNSYTSWKLVYVDEAKTQMKLTISGNGIMPIFGTGGAPWYGYAAQIVEIEVTEGVTNVGRCAFYNLTKVTKVTLPEGLESIDAYAFYGCKALTEIAIPSTVTTIDPTAFNKAGVTPTV